MILKSSRSSKVILYNVIQDFVVASFAYLKLVLYTLRTLLNNVYCARRSDIGIRKIESNLTDGCILSLLNNLELQDPSELFDDDMHDYNYVVYR